MRDVESYAQILGNKVPWFVDMVDLKVAENSVWLDYGPVERSPCLECGKLLPWRDHVGEHVRVQQQQGSF
jgi:transposase